MIGNGRLSKEQKVQKLSDLNYIIFIGFYASDITMMYQQLEKLFYDSWEVHRDGDKILVYELTEEGDRINRPFVIFE